jgi:large exoprotein involved in heme utilization and adhesion
MRQGHWQSGWVLGLVTSSLAAPIAGFAQSNIVPDSTLGAENSTVIQNFGGQPVDAIAGGAQRGANLFHSFREFNVSQGRGAYFLSPNPAFKPFWHG